MTGNQAQELKTEDSPVEAPHHVHASDLFPKKPLVIDRQLDLLLPVSELCGENFYYLDEVADKNSIALSNYRVVIKSKASVRAIPLAVVDSIENEGSLKMKICTKDGRIFRYSFLNNDQFLMWCARLQQAVSVKDINNIFAFVFYAYNRDCTDQIWFCNSASNTPVYSFDKEVQRLKLIPQYDWVYTSVNKDYELCSSYPREHVIPKGFEDVKLITAAGFRAMKRFPSIVWRDVHTGTVLMRSSQPEVGWWYVYRNEQDEDLVRQVVDTCHRFQCSIMPEGRDPPTKKRMLIVDARSYNAAWFNRHKGGGYEFPEYYENCDIVFKNLVNIHYVRSSLHKLRTACHQVGTTCSDQETYSQKFLLDLQDSCWLQYISSLIHTAWMIACALHYEGRPVLVHCSDGWDRTPQLVSLAQLLIDPYYRTIEGFSILVEKEWIQYGHKFADRCNVTGRPNNSELSPVFIQWLDCVHQIRHQYPEAFQFNETFLVKLAHHVYSNLFGNFLYNNMKERVASGVDSSTASIWSLLSPQNKSIQQPFYIENKYKTLRPLLSPLNIHLWTAVFCPHQPPLPEIIETAAAQVASMPRRRSFDSLREENGLVAEAPPTRRLSDPNVGGTVQLGDELEPAISGSTCTLTGEPSSASMVSMSESKPMFTESCDNVCSAPSLAACGMESLQHVDHDGLAGVHTDCVQIDEENGMSDNGNWVEETEADSMKKDALALQVEEQQIENGEVEETIEHEGNNVKAPKDIVSEVNGCVEINKRKENNILDLEEGGHQQNGDMIDNPEIEDYKKMNNEDGVQIHGEEVNVITMGNKLDNESTVKDECVYMNGEVHTECGRNDTLPPSTMVCVSSTPRVTPSTTALYSPDSSPVAASTTLPADCIQSTQQLAHNQSNGPTDQLVDNQSNGPTDQLVDNQSNLPTEQIAHNQSNGHTEQIENLSNGPMDQTNGEVSVGLPITIPDEMYVFGPSAGHSNGIASASYEMVDLGTCAASQGGSKSSQSVEHDFSRLSDMATSTTDVSDSHVDVPRPTVQTRVRQHASEGNMQCVVSNTGSPMGSCSPGTADQQLMSYPNYLGDDGLPWPENSLEKTLMAVRSEYEAQIEQLKKELQEARQMHMYPMDMQKYLECNGDADGIGDEHSSLGSRSGGTSSDISWEQVEDKDAEMTLWVPDHVVTHCTGCQVNFWTARRKHHCRCCGKIFCGDCAKYFTPVPQQQLLEPVRVCKYCYSDIDNNTPLLYNGYDATAALSTAAMDDLEPL